MYAVYACYDNGARELLGTFATYAHALECANDAERRSSSVDCVITEV